MKVVAVTMRAMWDQLRSEVIAMASTEPLLANYLCKTIIDHASLIDALAELLAGKLASQNVPTKVLVEVISNGQEAPAQEAARPRATAARTAAAT
jgi:Serine acetyltransferase, N-terminal